MTKGRFVAYYRVSTDKQGRSGLGLEAQQEAVRRHLNGGSWELIAEVTEIESGKRADRPKLTEALRLCRLHNATLIIAKLDRLARNVHFVSGLMESGVDFMAVDFPTANRLTVHILAAVAEHEAKAISERTTAALAQKKLWYANLTDEERAELRAKGKPDRLGGRSEYLDGFRQTGTAASAKVRGEQADRRASDLAPIIHELQASGLTINAIARELTRRGIPTPRGKLTWASQQVLNILDRAPIITPIDRPIRARLISA